MCVRQGTIVLEIPSMVNYACPFATHRKMHGSSRRTLMTDLREIKQISNLICNDVFDSLSNRNQESLNSANAHSLAHYVKDLLGKRQTWTAATKNSDLSQPPMSKIIEPDKNTVVPL